jgi:DNA-binding HxlR family transcriptional regulator
LKHDRTIRACSIWRALDVVGDVPVLLLMEQALLGIHSFDEFVARTGLARSVVNGRLKKLVEEDCLAKVPRKGGRGFHYMLTPKGRDQFPNGLMMLRCQGSINGKPTVAISRSGYTTRPATMPPNRCRPAVIATPKSTRATSTGARGRGWRRSSRIMSAAGSTATSAPGARVAAHWSIQ